MQCSNCKFQNMPGTQVCGRCQSSLGLATAVMDVHPPRARAATKKIRQLLPVRRAMYAARDALHVEGIADRTWVTAASLPPLGIFLRMIVPGWSQFYLKQRLMGHLFLWSFVICLLLTIWNFGTTWGSIWLGMAFSVHSSAALNIVTLTFADAGTGDRIGRSVMVSVMLGVVVYLPIMWLLSEFAQPHTVQTALPPFQPGDVILVNRWSAPKRGDVVIYEIRYTPDREIGEHTRHLFVGENIDRVLAVPKDFVQVDSGQLKVNGRQSTWMPLNFHPLPKQVSFKIPPDSFLVLPSGAPGDIDLTDANLWQTIGCVSRDDIVGRALIQASPHSRVHFIR